MVTALRGLSQSNNFTKYMIILTLQMRKPQYISEQKEKTHPHELHFVGWS